MTTGLDPDRQGLLPRRRPRRPDRTGSTTSSRSAPPRSGWRRSSRTARSRAPAPTRRPAITATGSPTSPRSTRTSARTPSSSALVDAAHARGIKVFFDIITNHTADVIDYAEGPVRLPLQGGRTRTSTPTATSSTTATTPAPTRFPALDAGLASRTRPVFRTTADATVKVPAWLNDPTMYHNRGDSTFAGENSEYGDFFGLDDLFTERPEVVDGHDRHLRDVDHRRRHRRLPHRHRQARQPGVLAAVRARRSRQHAAQPGQATTSSCSARSSSADPAFMSRYTTEGKLPATLDFAFQGAARGLRRAAAATDEPARPLRRSTIYYTDARHQRLPPADVPRQPRHGPHRLRSSRRRNPAPATPSCWPRDKLAHALMFLIRGSRSSTPATSRASPATAATRTPARTCSPSPGRRLPRRRPDRHRPPRTADDNFDASAPALPVHRPSSATLARRPTRRCATAPRSTGYATTRPASTPSPASTAAERIEYVVALNNATTGQDPIVPDAGRPTAASRGSTRPSGTPAT